VRRAYFDLEEQLGNCIKNLLLDPFNKENLEAQFKECYQIASDAEDSGFSDVFETSSVVHDFIIDEDIRGRDPAYHKRFVAKLVGWQSNSGRV
jgi:hypothetical protein